MPISLPDTRVGGRVVPGEAAIKRPSRSAFKISWTIAGYWAMKLRPTHQLGVCIETTLGSLLLQTPLAYAIVPGRHKADPDG
jgi:hypothetical protein